jgi:predicted alpha/beta hydrolase family esterase
VKNAILMHGWADETELYDPLVPTASNSHWFPWLTKQLMIKDIHTVAVEMPNAPYPMYEPWKKEFERYDVTTETVLVGHSTGGGFLVRWLSEHPDVSVGNVVLVAPWMGINFGTHFDKTFFEFEIDPELASRTKNLTILASSNDFSAIQKSVALLQQKVKNIHIITLEDKGHFCLSDMGTVEFPELLAECVKQ